MQEPTTIQELSNLLVSGFIDWKKLGEVNVRPNQDGSLVIFNYSVLCTYQRRWNWFERVSRGLIMDAKTGKVVARPFDKFFNWGELENKPEGLPTEVVEKCDGSLGILYRYGPYGAGTYRIATRGSFDSEQALWATEYLKNYNLEDLPDEFTLLFEIIYPANRIIVDYEGREDLILLGVRDRFDGYDFNFDEVHDVAETFGFSVPERTWGLSMDDLLSRATEISANEEGWVCRFVDGTRVKVKGSEYLEIARLAQKMTDRFIFESLAEKGYEETALNAPEEFRSRVNECWEVFEKIEETLHRGVMEALDQVSGMRTRKQIAMYLNGLYSNLQTRRQQLSWVMLEYDGRSSRPRIKDHIMKNYRRYLEERSNG